jgi:hypothetical protein
MNRSKQVVSRAGSALSVLAAVASIGACSAGPEPTRSELTGEATALQAIAYPPPSGCALGVQVSSFDPPAEPWPGQPGFGTVKGPPISAAAFTAEMQSLGCMPETFYGKVAADPPGSYGVAFCPTAPDVPLVRTMTPDACTGAPPPGWVVAVWLITAADPYTRPAGCGGFQCML